MEDSKTFWADVAAFIEKEYGRGAPEQWKETVIQEFLLHLGEMVRPILAKDKELLKACGGAPWNPITEVTFRKIFRYKNSGGNKSTRNTFAIYMGYRSAEQYITHKLSSGTTTGSNGDALVKRNLATWRPTSKEPIPVTVQLPEADFAKEDKIEQWMLYEVAFLWHGKEPPSIQAHFYQMTREIEHTKVNLHKAVELGHLKAETKVFSNGITRYLTREALEEFVEKQSLNKPEFLNRVLRK